jgi:hypothetical protein
VSPLRSATALQMREPAKRRAKSVRGELESIGKLWSAVAEVRHEPATPLFFSAHNYPQHDAKAVSTLRSATALQICDCSAFGAGDTGGCGKCSTKTIICIVGLLVIGYS